jgi:hypothetical protein
MISFNNVGLNNSRQAYTRVNELFVARLHDYSLSSSLTIRMDGTFRKRK